MSDIKLFQISGQSVSELKGSSVALEKSLQNTIENNLNEFLGVKFLASEFVIKEGRMDTLGIDENYCPVIIEYKRGKNDNVINQGLFYLDWLMEHKRDFEWLVMDKHGKEAADAVEWSAPRLICIAGDFSRYDEHAIKQMGRNIELVRYRQYESGLLLLEQMTTASSPQQSGKSPEQQAAPKSYKTVSDNLEESPQELRERYEELKVRIETLGDDIQFKTLKFYFAFRRLKNFACVEVHKMTGDIIVFVKVDPESIELEEGFTSDVRNVGHFGTGDLKITISNDSDIDKAMPLIEQSYLVS